MAGLANFEWDLRDLANLSQVPNTLHESRLETQGQLLGRQSTEHVLEA